jgi:hypothetical protein
MIKNKGGGQYHKPKPHAPKYKHKVSPDLTDDHMRYLLVVKNIKKCSMSEAIRFCIEYCRRERVLPALGGIALGVISEAEARTRSLQDGSKL